MKRIVLFMVCIFLLPTLFAEASTKEKNVQLGYAAERGNLTDVQDALNDGADVNAKEDTFGSTALMRASYCGYTNGSYAEVVKLLLDKGADVNKKNYKGTTALMMASRSGCAEVVKLLLAKGVNVNVKTREGKTALMEASKGGYTEDEGTAALKTEVLRDRYAEVVKLLLDKEADVNKKNDEGETALMAASYGGNVEVVKLLLVKGADINVKNSKGETVLMIAKNKGKDVMNSKGKAALKMAKDKGKAEIVVILEKAGAKE